MRAPGLVAVAGVAGVLGFYSANYDRLRESPVALEEFNAVLFWLFGSLLFTVVAPSLAYFSQLFYASSVNEMDMTWQYPYVQSTRASRIYSTLGHVARVLCYAAVIASIVLLIWGGVHFLSLVEASNVRPTP